MKPQKKVPDNFFPVEKKIENLATKTQVPEFLYKLGKKNGKQALK